MAIREEKTILRDGRYGGILKSVVQSHIRTGEPVGSQAVCRDSGCNLSAATVRHAMSTLEEMGYLTQPHTSAGRVPTDRGYRVYVDHLLDQEPVSEEAEERLRAACVQGGEELEGALDETSRTLALLCGYACVAVPPTLERELLRDIRFIFLNHLSNGASQILLLLIYCSGSVRHRRITVEHPLSQAALDRYGALLSRRLEGMTLSQIRAQLQEEVNDGAEYYDLLNRKLLAVLSSPVGERDKLIVNGRNNLLDYPELQQAPKLQELMDAIEEKKKIIALLDRCLLDDGVRMFIGAEAAICRDGGCAVVAAKFVGPEGHHLGSVGVVGPTRLDYAHVIPLVQHTAKLLSHRQVSKSGIVDGKKMVPVQAPGGG